MKICEFLFKMSIASLLFVCLSGSSLKADKYIDFRVEKYVRFTLDENRNIQISGDVTELKEPLRIGICPEGGKMRIDDVFEIGRTEYSGIEDKIVILFNNEKCASINFVSSIGKTVMLMRNDAKIIVFDEDDNSKGIIYQCGTINSDSAADLFMSILDGEEVANKYTIAFDELEKALSSNSQYKVVRKSM